MAFEMASDIGRVVGAVLLIDHDRQIATHPDGIHVVEEEETIAAKQVLHIVLGGRDEDVDALVFEQGVESRRVEGREFYRIMSSFVHVVSPAGVSRLDRPFRRPGVSPSFDRHILLQLRTIAQINFAACCHAGPKSSWLRKHTVALLRQVTLLDSSGEVVVPVAAEPKTKLRRSTLSSQG